MIFLRLSLSVAPIPKCVCCDLDTWNSFSMCIIKASERERKSERNYILPCSINRNWTIFFRFYFFFLANFKPHPIISLEIKIIPHSCFFLVSLILQSNLLLTQQFRVQFFYGHTINFRGVWARLCACYCCVHSALWESSTWEKRILFLAFIKKCKSAFITHTSCTPLNRRP
jgi:hypothetical protein